MDSHPDWDLLAVVRSCSSTTATTPSPSLPPPLTPQQEQPCFTTAPTPPTCSSSSVFGFSSPLATTTFISRGQQELPLSCTTTNSFQSFSCSSPVSSSASIIAAQRSFTVAQEQQQQQRQLRRVVRPSQVIFGASSANVTTSQSQRSKKRKSLMKKVCNVPAEGLSSDMWAWRKYGQKPIKGSPHPRGYYRCSSSKGCLARKQVERNRSDPKMFIVTYTSEHNHPMPTHRNSLAGSTRQKPLNSTATPPEQPTCSSPSTTNVSPSTETTSKSKTLGENLMKYEDNDMGVLSDLMLKDDFFVGFEQIDGGSDHPSFHGSIMVVQRPPPQPVRVDFSLL